MKILVVHNFYQQAGGEDAVFRDEMALLRERGHEVEPLVVHNDDVRTMGRFALLAKTSWNTQQYQRILACVRRSKPAVVHFHNTFPLVSPAAYYAARKGGAAVVQTLHNYRLLCPAATFYRDGHPCEKCLSRPVAWPAVRHRCYRCSASASAATTAMLALHRAMGTWHRAVDAYIALTDFARRKYVHGGLPEQRISVKPNFVAPDPGPGTGGGGYLLFVGRLSSEKGISTLLEAWGGPLAGRVPLKIVGDGPLREAAQQVDGGCGVEVLGPRTRAEIDALLGTAEALLFPSLCYETFGRTIIEAYAKGTPVIASAHGAAAEIVRPGLTGVLHQPGSAPDLARAVKEVLAQPSALQEMRGHARREFLARYTGDRNYVALLEIYEQALATREALARRGHRLNRLVRSGDNGHSDRAPSLRTVRSSEQG